MVTPRLVTALTLSFIACFTSATAFAADANLRPKFKVGAESRYEINGMSRNVTKAAMLPNGEMAQVVTQNSRVAFKVTEVTKDFATIEAVYEHIKMDVKSPSPDMTPSFDSDQSADKDANNSLAPVLRPIVGAKIMLKISLNGEIMDVKAPDLKAQAEPLNSMAMQFVDPKSVKSNFAMIFSCHNESGVAEKGAVWTNVEEHQLAPGATLTQKLTFTLTSIEANIANLAITGVADLKISGGQMQGARLEESKINGVALWDSSVGMLKSADTKNFMRITAEPQPGMTMTIEADLARAFRRID